MISIMLNGDAREIPEQQTLLDLLSTLKLSPKNVLLEHNGTALARDQWPSVILQNGDQIEIVRMVAGG
jgi:sulfur carrier protein